MRSIGGFGGFGGRGGGGNDHAPVELRFVDLLLIIIAILMFMAVLLSMVSANAPAGDAKQSPARQVTITTAKAPDALVGERYELTLAAEGGQGTYAWTRVRGSLPAGLSLSPGGVVSGSPEPAGTKGSAVASATVRVEDGAGHTAERTLKWSVRRAQDEGAARPNLRVTAAAVSVPDGTAGRAYKGHRFTAQAGTGPYTWEAEGLPEGMELSRSGQLTGKPAKTGGHTFKVKVKDRTGAQVAQDVRLYVGEAAEPKKQEEDDGWDLPPWVVILLALPALLGLVVVAHIVKVALWGERGGTYYTPERRGLLR